GLEWKMNSSDSYESEEDLLDFVQDRLSDNLLVLPKDVSSPKLTKAPTVVIKAVHVGRPQKVVAFLANLAALFLLITSSVSTAWMQTEAIRIGLFHECLKLEETWVKEEMTRRQMTNPDNACTMSECISIIRHICGSLNLISVLLAVLTLLVMGYGMNTVKVSRKNLAYNVTIAFNCVNISAMVSVLIMLPILFTLQLQDENFPLHPHGSNLRIGWSLIAAIVAVILLSFQTIIVLLDKSDNEIIYREQILREQLDYEPI
ncbi:hypothetical protein Ciccas_008181, partial [Cichlidogyrus casuarinus]